MHCSSRISCNSLKLCCHGEMLAVGGEFPLQDGGSLDGTNDGGSRRPWLDLPRCQSCHTGDAVDHLTGPTLVADSDWSFRLRQAFLSGDGSASPLLAVNRRFAENANTLFRFRDGHEEAYEADPDSCRACHGLDLSGTALARMPTARRFRIEDDEVVAYAKGDLVRCDRCHGMPES